MTWLSDLLAMQSKIATLLLRVDNVVSQAEKLDDRTQSHAVEIAELKGLLKGLPAVALLDKIETQSNRISDLELHIGKLENLLREGSLGVDQSRGTDVPVLESEPKD